MKTIYIAGPMRGYPLYNFPAFDKAAAQWRARGWEVHNPADVDREHGFDEHSRHDVTPPDLYSMLMRDLELIYHSDAIGLLPGWPTSSGVSVELPWASIFGREVYLADTFRRVEIHYIPHVSPQQTFAEDFTIHLHPETNGA